MQLEKKSNFPKKIVPFKRIFWRIFIAFWLANLLIMLATTFVLLHHVESERRQQDFQEFVGKIVDRLLINPDGTAVSPDRLKHKIRRLAQKDHKTPRGLAVYENGQLLFTIGDRPNAPKPDYHFSLTLSDGRLVEVRTQAPRLPKILLDHMKRIHAWHFVFMLFASTGLSFILSWSITRPLQKLGHASRQFALGNQEPLHPPLLARADEIGQLARDVDYMMRTVSQTLASQRQMLHDVSHELRAPLARLQVAAELIQQKDEKDLKHIQRIHAECERIDHLIQRILNFARLEQAAEPTHFAVTELLDHLVETIKYESPDKAIRIHAEKNSFVLFARKELIEHAVENILRNAVKYAPENTPIDIAVREERNVCVISIRDYGPGVPEQDISKLKEPFYRANNRMHGTGYGLGLSIAHRAIESHGGKLRFANHAGGGLEVTILIPLQ